MKQKGRRGKKKHAALLFLGGMFLLLPLILFSLLRGAENFSGQINANPSNQNFLELWNDREYPRILTLAEESLEKDPMDSYSLLFAGLSSYYIALSQISAQDERFYLDKAIISLRKLLIFQDIPKEEIVYYTLGKSYLMKGPYYADLALEYLRKARDMGYQNADTYEQLGEAYSVLGDFEQSVRYYEQALDLYDSDRLYLKIAEDCFQFGMYEKSADYYGALIAETQDESLKKKGLFQLGKLYYDIKNLVKARETFEKLNDLDPTGVEGHFLLGETYFFLGDATAARSEWHKTLRIDPEHRGARLRLYN